MVRSSSTIMTLARMIFLSLPARLSGHKHAPTWLKFIVSGHQALSCGGLYAVQTIWPLGSFPQLGRSVPGPYWTHLTSLVPLRCLVQQAGVPEQFQVLDRHDQ